MSMIRGLTDLKEVRGGVLAIGNFDGVHRGHQAMIAELRRLADAEMAPAVAVTFEPPPAELLRPEQAPPRLMTLMRKVSCLRTAGADHVLVLATDRSLLELPAETFYADVLIGKLAARGFVEGANFRFGRGRLGDVALLRRLAETDAIACVSIPPVEIDGRVVSSSVVREAVSKGDVRQARRLLGRPHEASGVVVRGAARGRELGFPTANVTGIKTLLPPDGVYAGRALVDGKSFTAAVHLGANSTFGETSRTFEAHLLGYSGDLYDRELRVELIERVRDSERFDGRASLVRQILDDCERAREAVARVSDEG